MSMRAGLTMWIVGTAGALTLSAALVQLGAASRGNFHWGAAAIGAAGALGLVLVVAGIVFAWGGVVDGLLYLSKRNRAALTRRSIS